MPHPVDQHVGKMLRLVRIANGMSQTQVADCLGISFQQIQKYESGSNRISASTLWILSNILNTNPSYFFKDYQDVESDYTIMFEKEHLSLLRSWYAVNDSKVRSSLLQLINDIAKSDR